MNGMNVWIIEPRDPLIVRDGRPFGPIPGARARSLPFPFPSTIAGGVRTRDGLDPEGRFKISEIPRLKRIAVRGPLLVELDSSVGDIRAWFAPAPADALLLDVDPPGSGRAVIKRLVPLRPPSGASTNLPPGLVPVGMPEPDPRKPCPTAPRFWNWERFERWLVDPQQEEVRLADLGCNGPIQETRTHVRILGETGTGAEGALFQTRGLEFTQADTRERLALAVATDAPNLRVGVAPLGGERRLVFWRKSNRHLPQCPAELPKLIGEKGHCRVILLTPAHFLKGSMPSWLLEDRHGVQPSLAAMALPRAQVVSGWDLEKRKPKPTRRLAPAGTVLFFKLTGETRAIQGWVEALWMQCISDEEQARRDGFGLAVLGVWDGELRPMRIGKEGSA